jgi:hypothetical protein
VLALSYAQARYLAATQPPDDLASVSEEAARFRERLLAEARSLTHHGLVTAEQLAQLKGAHGYKNVATDLMVLVRLLRGKWAEIEGKSLTTAADLEQASRVATRLLRIVGLREQGPAQVAVATETRLRAFTLFLQSYEDARGAVGYLRAADGDADSITPALHPGRPRRRATEDPNPAAQSAPASPGKNDVAVPPPTGVTTAPPLVPPPTAAKSSPLESKGPFL